MTGHEGLHIVNTRPDPLEADTSTAPQTFPPSEYESDNPAFFSVPEVRATHETHDTADKLITPEGYNVKDLSQTIAWLKMVHERDGNGFELPEPKGDVDRFTGRDITYSWARVKRDAKHEDGSHQTDAEHSAVAAMTAIEIMGRLGYPRELIGEVVMDLLVHDRDEAPSDDIGIYDRRRPEKPFRVEASHVFLRERDKDNPLMLELMEETRTHSTEAARISDSIEKTEPGLQALSTKCKTQRERKDKFPDMVRKHLEGASRHEIGFNLCADVSVLIGLNWHKWGCVPFEGDPVEIVATIKSEVREAMRTVELAELEPAAAEHPFPLEKPLKERQSSIDAEKAREYGNVAILPTWRNRPGPQTPPPSPTAAGLPIPQPAVQTEPLSLAAV